MTEPAERGVTLWEQELFAHHRWGQHGERGGEEQGKLLALWRRAQPLDKQCQQVLEQIVALEICNWNLEDSLMALARAIGGKTPAALSVGHLPSVTEERWRHVWAYYLALRNWLPCQVAAGYDAILGWCDPSGRVRERVTDLLGKPDQLKQLYLERFCLCLEFWLGGYYPSQSAQMTAHAAAVEAVEQQIGQLDPNGDILGAMHDEGNGRLQPCHHKAFRRYEIIISSIGAGQWRAVMPMRGTDGIERGQRLSLHTWTPCSRGSRRRPVAHEPARMRACESGFTSCSASLMTASCSSDRCWSHFSARSNSPPSSGPKPGWGGKGPDPVDRLWKESAAAVVRS